MLESLKRTPSITKTHTSRWVESWVKVNMLILHPESRHSATEPYVTMVTEFSRGWKGESWSSESTRSTTTPGWRHWLRRRWRVSHGCVCVCVVGDWWCSCSLYPLMEEIKTKIRTARRVDSHSWCPGCRFCQLQLSAIEKKEFGGP